MSKEETAKALIEGLVPEMRDTLKNLADLEDMIDDVVSDLIFSAGMSEELYFTTGLRIQKIRECLGMGDPVVTFPPYGTYTEETVKKSLISPSTPRLAATMVMFEYMQQLRKQITSTLVKACDTLHRQGSIN